MQGRGLVPDMTLVGIHRAWDQGSGSALAGGEKWPALHQAAGRGLVGHSAGWWEGGSRRAAGKPVQVSE